MPAMRTQLQKHRHTLPALLAAAVCLAVLGLVWAAAVRPQTGKSLSAFVSDDYTASTRLEDGQTVRQSFAFDEGPLALGFVFFAEGEQPQGTLELTLSDAGSGAVLARSSGEMGLILPGQYTVLGLDTPLPDTPEQRYTVALTPHYSGAGRLAVGHSEQPALWQEAAVLDGAPLAGTLSLLISYHRIGGFLNRFFLLVGLFACIIVFFGVRAALAGQLRLHRAVFALAVAFGLLYSVVLPPYAAPDEKYHINQSFTLACKWSRMLLGDERYFGIVPTTTSFRREHDANALIQDEHTTVFTWEELTGQMFTRSPDAFGSATQLDELQTDTNPLLYLPSAAAVFLAFALRLGFVPALMLGRLANLLVFAALAAWAVRQTPFGRRVFAAAALLPMTLHLAVSFSRDALLLGLCFAFTALYLEAAFGRDGGALPLPRLLGMAACGILLAPAKVVYLPLVLLALTLPAARLGAQARLKKAAYLAACVLVMLFFNRAFLAERLGLAPAAPAAAETVAPLSLTPLPGSTEVAQQWSENTLENYVRRLFYWADGNADAPDSEVEFWVQAMRDGDVSPVLLAQSFFFSPEHIDDPDDARRATQISEVFLQQDVLTSGLMSLNPPMSYPDLLAQQNLILFFKNIYCREEVTASFQALGVEPGIEDDTRYPLDRAELVDEVNAARATRAAQSTVAEEDLDTWTPGYILAHPAAALMLAVRSVLENGDHYLRGLVGGSLSYYSLDLAWGWVLVIYLMLWFACCSTAAEQDSGLLPAGRDRAWCLLAVLLCCALTVGGCILWTPLSHTTIYGLQGRYFLPLLPMVLCVLPPRSVRLPDTARAESELTGVLCLINAGVLINIMLAVIAR